MAASGNEGGIWNWINSLTGNEYPVDEIRKSAVLRVSQKDVQAFDQGRK